MKKRYVVVGTGGRSWLYLNALAGDFRDSVELVALCDPNQVRMNFYNRKMAERHGAAPVPTYRAVDFSRMLFDLRPDGVIVTSIDRTHHEYIVAGLEAGCDVICEKPMTIDIGRCRAILDAVERTGRRLTVTFNYRYAPLRSKVKELIQGGAIGEVKSVHFEWLLDTNHGADYFRRWHRDKRNSGGLMVHKATHHFDLINWWLDSSPETVRIEVNHAEASYINAGTGELSEGVSASEQILLLPMFARPQVIDIPRGEGGHGGGDPRMLKDIFGLTEGDDPLGRGESFRWRAIDPHRNRSQRIDAHRRPDLCRPSPRSRRARRRSGNFPVNLTNEAAEQSEPSPCDGLRFNVGKGTPNPTER